MAVLTHVACYPGRKVAPQAAPLADRRSALSRSACSAWQRSRDHRPLREEQQLLCVATVSSDLMSAKGCRQTFAETMTSFHNPLRRRQQKRSAYLWRRFPLSCRAAIGWPGPLRNASACFACACPTGAELARRDGSSAKAQVSTMEAGSLHPFLSVAHFQAYKEGLHFWKCTARWHRYSVLQVYVSFSSLAFTAVTLTRARNTATYATAMILKWPLCRKQAPKCRKFGLQNAEKRNWPLVPVFGCCDVRASLCWANFPDFRPIFREHSRPANAHACYIMDDNNARKARKSSLWQEVILSTVVSS